MSYTMNISSCLQIGVSESIPSTTTGLKTPLYISPFYDWTNQDDIPENLCFHGSSYVFVNCLTCHLGCFVYLCVYLYVLNVLRALPRDAKRISVPDWQIKLYCKVTMIVSALHFVLWTSLLYRRLNIFSLSCDKCTYCESLWIKASDECPKCKCKCKTCKKKP